MVEGRDMGTFDSVHAGVDFSFLYICFSSLASNGIKTLSYRNPRMFLMKVGDFC